MYSGRNMLSKFQLPIFAAAGSANSYNGQLIFGKPNGCCPSSYSLNIEKLTASLIFKVAGSKTPEVPNVMRIKWRIKWNKLGHIVKTNLWHLVPFFWDPAESFDLLPVGLPSLWTVHCTNWLLVANKTHPNICKKNWYRFIGITLLLADPGEARGCSTKTSVINSLSQWVTPFPPHCFTAKTVRDSSFSKKK